MALDTLRANKMRSALTVLGVVIGITSIVGMTSLIRGFDESLQRSINALGPKTIFVAKFGALSLSSGRVVHRADAPARTSRSDDGEAIRRLAPSVAHGRHLAGRRRRRSRRMERVFYRGERTRPVSIMGTTERFVEVNFAKMVAGRVVHRAGSAAPQGAWRSSATVRTRRSSSRRGIDPIGKKVRIGAVEYTIIGVIGKRPAAGGFSLGQDDFAIIPYTALPQAVRLRDASRGGPFGGGPAAMIAVVPHESATREEAMREVEEIMRIRHGLTLDKPNDFDIVTQDADPRRCGSRSRRRCCCRWS